MYIITIKRVPNRTLKTQLGSITVLFFVLVIFFSVQMNVCSFDIHFNFEMKAHSLLMVWEKYRIEAIKPINSLFCCPILWHSCQIPSNVLQSAKYLEDFCHVRARIFEPESSASPIQTCLLGTVGKYWNCTLNWFKWPHTSPSDILKLFAEINDVNTAKQYWFNTWSIDTYFVFVCVRPPKHSNNGSVLC